MGKSLLDVLREVVIDPGERAALADLGVTGYLARHGYEDVDPDDLREAVSLAADALPPDIAQVLADTSQSVPEIDQPPEAPSTEGADAETGLTHPTDDDGADHSLLAFGAGSGAGAYQQDPIDDGDHDAGERGLTLESESSFGATPPVDAGLDTQSSLDDVEGLGEALADDFTSDGPGEPTELDDIGSF